LVLFTTHGNAVNWIQ